MSERDGQQKAEKTEEKNGTKRARKSLYITALVKEKMGLLLV